VAGWGSARHKPEAWYGSCRLAGFAQGNGQCS
jgi:hypothetical protein